MLHLLTGPDRQANTAHVIETICARARAGIGGQILIVPEQYSFETEQALCRTGGDTISRYAEVLSFTRLAARVFSIYGGVSERYLDEGGRLLCLYLAAERMKTQIKYYASALQRPEFLGQLGQMVEELMSYCVSPEQILRAAEKFSGQRAQKLTEIGLLYESYLSVCKTGSADPVTRAVRLGQMLQEEDYASGRYFYLDGFSDFTGVQLQILQALAPQAKELCVCLCTDGSQSAAYSAGSDTTQTLFRMAARQNVQVIRARVEEKTPRPQALAFWLEHVFDAQDAPLDAPAPEVALSQTASIAQACALAAGKIKKLTSGGVRWRQIAVALADPAYESALRPMLERAGIAAYYAGTVDILQKPLLAAVLSAMQAASRFAYEDVMQYLKSGFSPLEMDACDRLEHYAYFWNIRGQQWLEEWTRHPDGFGREMDDQARQTLFTLNTWREGAMQPLRQLHEAWLRGRTVSERVRALSDFLEQTDFPQTACEQTNELYAQGRPQAAQEQEQLYEILMTAMEQAELVLGPQEMELERFLQMFRMLLGCYKVGSIPATLDQVLVGSLQSMRHKHADFLIVLGADEGALPAFSQQAGLLSDDEREGLAKLGVVLSPCRQARLERELGWTALALQSAQREVLLISGSEQPSYLMARTARILPQCARLSPQEMPFVPDRTALAAAALREEADGQVWQLDPLALQARRELEKRRNYVFSPLARDTVQGLYGRELRLSSSRLDRFAGCRYAFFLHDGLKLEPWKQASFDAPAFGTFAHYVLECTVRDVMAQGGFAAAADDTVQAIAARHMDEYAQKFVSSQEDQDGRMEYLFRRNREEVLKITHDVAQELRASRFMPCDEELAFAKDGKLPPVMVETPDGQAVLSGFVDRVDIFDNAGQKYFRVIDYKTGHKEFDYTDLLCGQGLQMLIYLFGIERASGGHVAAGRRPAGVLYVPGRCDVERLEPGQGEEKLQAQRQKHLQRQGLVLRDEAVLQAMEPGEQPAYLPYQIKKGELTGDLATAEQFRLLEQFVSQSLRSMTGQIFSGSVTPNPIVRGLLVSSCQYCAYRDACHMDACAQQPRYMKKIGADEFWAELERRRADG